MAAIKNPPHMQYLIYKVKTDVPPSGIARTDAFEVVKFDNPTSMNAYLRVEIDKAVARGYLITRRTPSEVSLGREVEFEPGSGDAMQPAYHVVLQYYTSVAFEPSLFFNEDQLVLIRDLVADRLSKITVSDFMEATQAGDDDNYWTDLLSVINVVQRRTANDPYKDLTDFITRSRSGSWAE